MVSPKWQTMWTESQHCSKSIVNVPLPSQQAKKILEDLKTSCCSPNKAVQVEALKCWELWIHNQNPDDWKVNAVCFTAVRPLITKKLQPLHKDVDICKLKLCLMWALLVKVQDIMHLEGPQYILEVFLQSCLTWLSSSGDDSENKLFILIFQLLLAVFNKNETLTGCDKEMFPPLSSDVLHLKKVFHRLADKFLNIFTYWRKVKDKSVILKLWKHFLEHCELSHEHIPIPIWHRVFKLAGEIFSEKDEPVKERLAFLHCCATTLKSALSSSKFIDFGNLLTTPCEVLLKKLVELCTINCNESRDPEMFVHSKEICQVLSDKSVAISGYDLCIGVVDVLEDFCLRSLFWGVWCGLVYCYKTLLKDTHRNHLTKTEMKFYRKLRGAAVNFELDRSELHEDGVEEVERHIGFLNIGCFCSSRSAESADTLCQSDQAAESVEPLQVEKPRCGFTGVSNEIVPVVPKCALGKFSLVVLTGRKHSRKTLSLNFDLIKDILNTLSINSTKSLLGSMFTYRFIRMQTARQRELMQKGEIMPRRLSLPMVVGVSREKETSPVVSCLEEKAPSPKPPCTPVKKNADVPSEVDEEVESDEVISTPTTRSKKRAEEERKKELEMQKRRKRKSFEVLVQEIVRKNKERKTEKNSKRKKTQDTVKGKRGKKKKVEGGSDKEKRRVSNVREKGNKPSEVSDRRLRNSKREEQPKNEKKKEKVSVKTDGKLENYFEVITKKSVNGAKKEVKKPSKAKKSRKKTMESSCCDSEKDEGERRGEIGWRQTSLKTMMNTKSKAEKVKQGMRTRDKSSNVTEEKPKVKKDERKLLGSSLARSPFKEVLHDHEYAKMEPGKMETLEKVVVAKTEKKERKTRVKSKTKAGKIDLNKTFTSQRVGKIDCLETKAFSETKTSKVKKAESEGDKMASVDAPAPSEQNSPEKPELEEAEVPRLPTPEEPECQKVEVGRTVCVVMDQPITENISCDEETPKKPNSKLIERNSQAPPNKVDVDETREEFSENELTPDKRGSKRVRMLDSLTPSKKIKLEEAEEDPLDEKLPLEVTEKENLEEKHSELISKKENGGCLVPRNNGSPKAVGSGMSRALRIIGLVPESTMGRSWESSPKMEAWKFRKAPNVDKNSRASKMLALLSENIVEAEEVVKENEEEVHRTPTISSTPIAKPPLSSLKSPKSIKKRRSIRFDDAKNETVLYQIHLPPSQILEEKEKRRGVKPFEIPLHLP